MLLNLRSCFFELAKSFGHLTITTPPSPHHPKNNAYSAMHSTLHAHAEEQRAAASHTIPTVHAESRDTRCGCFNADIFGFVSAPACVCVYLVGADDFRNMRRIKKRPGISIMLQMGGGGGEQCRTHWGGYLRWHISANNIMCALNIGLNCGLVRARPHTWTDLVCWCFTSAPWLG